MNSPFKFRIGGYSPIGSTHSSALMQFKESLEKETGGAINTNIFWNILDFGYRADDLLSMVECGLLTMCYFSTSYLAAAVPELEIIDLPYIFRKEKDAHSALDGALGDFLSKKTEERTGFCVLGYWDNGFRHLSNRLRSVRVPADCSGMRIRLQPNNIHVETFKLLGAIPVPTDLKEGIEKIASHNVDAQENPLANTVSYGVTEHHRHVTMSGHFFGVRGLYMHKNSFDSWGTKIQSAVKKSARNAIQSQRILAMRQETELRAQLEKKGVEVIDLSTEERNAFIKTVKPVLDNARRRLDSRLFELVEG